MLSRSRKILNAVVNSKNVNNFQGHNGEIVTDSNYSTSESALPVTEKSKEREENSYSSLETKVIDFFNLHFSMDLDRRDIQETRRIGKKKGGKPRPVTVTFSLLRTKVDIISRKNTLNDTEYYIKEDFPQHIIEKRKMLQEQLKLEKEKGNSATIKYDKLIIYGKNENGLSKKKRALTLSPENPTLSQTSQKAQVNKKNKTHTSFKNLPETLSKPGLLNYFNTKNGNSLSSNELEKHND